MVYTTLLTQIDQYTKLIHDYRPLTKNEIKALDAYFRIVVTYSSNALEGNSLTLSETKILLEDGITVGGKPIRDCYEATGHAKAYDYMLTLARSDRFELTEDTILRLHHLFCHAIDEEQAGQYRTEQVFITGTTYVPPVAAEVPGLMQEFLSEFAEKRKTLHPVQLAAYAHRRLVDIHPFQDGNGRTARLLMNLILINAGYCVVSIPPILRHEYIAALQQAQREHAPDDGPFIKLIAECELEVQKDYCRMFRIKTHAYHKTDIER